MIRKNILANVIGRAWGFISVYLFVPLYLHFLGIEAYGLVGFYSTLLGVLAFADMGFTATLNREMARLAAVAGSAGEMRNLLRTYETAYCFISSALALVFWILSPLLVEHWLRSSSLSPSEMVASIRLMGIAIAFQLPSGLYIGGLMGLQLQVQANVIQIGWGVVRGIGTVLALWILSPTIFTFALWQLVSNAFYCYFARTCLWRALSCQNQEPARFKWQALRSTWRYAAGMAGMAVVSALLTQTDKLAVSKMLSLEALGYYTLAGSLAAVPVMLSSPIASAVFPRLTELAVSRRESEGLKRLYHRSCEFVSVSIIPAGLTLAFFAEQFIFAWTGDESVSRHAGLVASLLLAGQVVQAILVVPYYLALAHGNLRLNLLLGVMSVLLITPLLILLIRKYGMLGAGISWLGMNLFTLPPYMYLLHRRFLPGELHVWVWRDVCRPLLASLPVILLARLLLPMPASRILIFGVIGLLCCLSVGAAAFVVPELRGAFILKTRRLAPLFKKSSAIPL